MVTKVAPPANEDTERSILGIAPDREGLDWICYRVRGGLDPASDKSSPEVTTDPASPPREPPRREDIARALGNLVNLGMLTYDGQRWTMTAKGYASI